MPSPHALRARRIPAALAILALTGTGCSGIDDAQQTVDDAQNLVSTTQTCAELVQIAAGRLDDVQNSLDNEAKLKRTLRRSAAELEAKAADVDDPELKKAIDTYVAKMQRVAVRAEQGRTPDLGDLEAANGALVDACS